MADRLRSLKNVTDLSEGQQVQVERDIFIGFYSVRKLFDAIAKVSDATKAMKAPLEWYPNRSPVTWLNAHRLTEIYDLGNPKADVKDMRFICGRIIHSFIFAPCMDDHGLAGIFFTSDIDRKSKLYFLRVDEVIKIFEQVGNDYPSSIEWTKDEKTGTETTIVK